MKTTLLIALIVLSSIMYAQQHTSNQNVPGINKQVNNSTNKKFSNNNQVSSLSVNDHRHDTCIGKKFSIVMYYIQDSSYIYNTALGIQNRTAISNTIINILNKAFSPICVSFENCSTVIIPHYPYNEWNKVVTDTAVTTAWYTPNTINLYLPTEIKPPGPFPDLFGYSYPAPTSPTVVPKNVIVVERDRAIDTNYAVYYKGSHMLHAFGHFFGLPHTFDEINPNLSVTPAPPSGVISREFVDRITSNCLVHGDGFCDTEADPFPTGITPGPWPFCYYTSGLKDGNGQAYNAPVYNFMSAGTFCRCKFSHEQYYYMAKYIMKYRMYLH